MKLLKEKGGLEQAQQDFGGRYDRALTKSEKDFDFSLYAREWLKAGVIQDKRQVLTELGWNHILGAEKLTLSLKETFKIISADHESIVEHTAQLEPLYDGVDKGKAGPFGSAFPTLLRGRDSNPRPSGSFGLLRLLGVSDYPILLRQGFGGHGHP